MKAQSAQRQVIRRAPARRSKALAKLHAEVKKIRATKKKLWKCRGDRDGTSCDNAAIPGSQWCLVHGGANGKTREELELWMALMAPAAMDAIGTLLANKKTPAHVLLGAAEAVLDRTGFSRKTEITLGRPVAQMSTAELFAEAQRVGLRIEDAERQEARDGRTDLGGQSPRDLERGDEPGRPVDVPAGDQGVVLPLVRWRPAGSDSGGGPAGGPHSIGADDSLGVLDRPGGDAAGGEPLPRGGRLHGDGAE